MNNLSTPYPMEGDGVNEIIDKVTDFVETVRINTPPQQQMTRCSEVEIPGFEEAKKWTDAAIIEAEKFRAKVVSPPGLLTMDDDCRGDCANPEIEEVHRNSMINALGVQTNHDIGTRLSDDDSFHLMSHIEPLLKQKIERGEFIDLDKLLLKDRVTGVRKFSNDNRIEWVQHDGGTFLVPAKRESRITSFRRWEQAFRMYATIYCGANPHRAKEIWQYISVINTAASAYVWENVYSYDVTFRQLMQFNPNRSWAVAYNQMWNLSIREPIQRNGGYKGNNFSSGSNFQGQGQAKGSAVAAHQGKRPKYCWGFNKGIPCKFGKSCTYIERCSYCDSPAHSVNACPKLQKKGNNQNNQSKNGQSQNSNNSNNNSGHGNSANDYI